MMIHFTSKCLFSLLVISPFLLAFSVAEESPPLPLWRRLFQKKKPGVCKDPLSAVLKTLQCVADADPKCASAGYDAKKFIKLHNGIDTETPIDSRGVFWKGAFTQVDFDFSFDHTANVGPNMASVRYIEKVEFTDGTNYDLPPSNEYPWGFSFVQHEHALVTVDGDCRITLWDQYGDNAEQKLNDDAVEAMMGILCSIGKFPRPVCWFLKIPIPDADDVPDYVEDEEDEVDEKGESIGKRVIKRYIKSKKDALLEGNRFLSKTFPKKNKNKAKDEL